MVLLNTADKIYVGGAARPPSISARISSEDRRRSAVRSAR